MTGLVVQYLKICKKKYGGVIVSMRIVTPKGAVRKIDKAYPFTEASTYINNRRKYIFEPAEKLQYATGVVLTADMNLCGQNVFTIGNLKNATVREIVHSLAEKGFYDFSGIEYQNAKNMKDVVIDGGIKPPYCSDFTNIDDMALSSISLSFENADIFTNTFAGCSELPFPNDDYVDCTTGYEDNLLKALAGEGEKDFTEDGGEEGCD